jgi:hypothetical protein
MKLGDSLNKLRGNNESTQQQMADLIHTQIRLLQNGEQPVGDPCGLPDSDC